MNFSVGHTRGMQLHSNLLSCEYKDPGQGPGDESRGTSPHRPVQRCHKPKCSWTIHSVRIRRVEASITTGAVIRSVKLDAMQSMTANCAKACVFVTQFMLASFSHAKVKRRTRQPTPTVDWARDPRHFLSRPLFALSPVRPFSFPHGPVREQHRHGREKEAGPFRHLT